jgi:hypothetical protein
VVAVVVIVLAVAVAVAVTVTVTVIVVVEVDPWSSAVPTGMSRQHSGSIRKKGER